MADARALGFWGRRKLGICTTLLFLTAAQLTNRSIRDPGLAAAPTLVLAESLRPFQEIQHEFLASYNYVVERYAFLQNAAEERDLLQVTNKELIAENAMLNEQLLENARLRRILDFQRETGLTGIVAAVIGRDSSNWADSITINRGSAHGIQSGNAVVAGEALIGRTTRVSPRSARVLLVSDHASAVDVIIQDTRVSGILEGTGSTKLRMTYVEKDREVRPGQRVVTSGLDKVYPKGIPVGVVATVSAGSGALFQDIEVKLTESFTELENILVLKPWQMERKRGPLDFASAADSAGSEVQECSMFAGSR